MSSEKERMGEVTVAGRKVPVYCEDKTGKMVILSDDERGIALDVIGRAFATPITAITIIAMGAYRDIRVTFAKASSFMETELDAIDEATNIEKYKIRAEGEAKRMKDTYNAFFTEIKSLDNSNDPEEYKEILKKGLTRRMKERLDSFSK